MESLYRITLVALLFQLLVFGAACDRAEDVSHSGDQPAVSEKLKNTSTERISAEQDDEKTEKELRLEKMRKRIRERMMNKKKDDGGKKSK